MSGRTRLVPFLVLAIFLASCSREPEASAEATVSSATPVASTATADPVATSVAAVSVGTTALPLTIRFEVPAVPRVGQPAKVTLSIAVDQPVQRVEIDGRSATLLVDESTAKLVLEGMVPGQARQVDLGFTSQADGLADIELDVRVQTESGPLQSSFAIPVLTMAAEAPAAGG